MIVVVQHYYMREVHKRAGELLLVDDDDLDWIE